MDGSESGVQRGEGGYRLMATVEGGVLILVVVLRLGSDRWSARSTPFGRGTRRGTAAHITGCPRALQGGGKSLGWQRVAEGYIGPPSRSLARLLRMAHVQTTWTVETIPASTMDLRPPQTACFRASVTNR